MSNYTAIKERFDNVKAKEVISDLLITSNIINIVIDNEVYLLDYLFQDNNHYVFIPKPLVKKEISSGVINFDNNRSKIQKQIRFNFELEVAESITTNDIVLKKKMAHGVSVFKMNNIKTKVILDTVNQFEFNDNFDVNYLKYDLYNKERFVYSRLVCLSYLDREFLLNVIVEDDCYYALTKVYSNKVNHINNNGIFKCYDGINNQFECNIEILDNTNVDIIFNKLLNTNNSYFKEKYDLIAIKYKKKKA